MCIRNCQYSDNCMIMYGLPYIMWEFYALLDWLIVHTQCTLHCWQFSHTHPWLHLSTWTSVAYYRNTPNVGTVLQTQTIVCLVVHTVYTLLLTVSSHTSMAAPFNLYLCCPPPRRNSAADTEKVLAWSGSDFFKHTRVWILFKYFICLKALFRPFIPGPDPNFYRV